MYGSGMRTLILLSGGMDSTTLLAEALQGARRDDIGTLSVIYGQRHVREVPCAARVARYYGVMHDTITLPDASVIFAGSSQTDLAVPVPHGRYDEPSMKKTVVPNRNMVLLSLAGAFAIGHGYGRLAYAAHGGDHAIYPDCRPEFVEAMAAVFHLCDWQDLSLWVPYLRASKGDICKRGLALGVPYQLTWTCYEGGTVACGKCGACDERLEAFAFAGAKDPLTYAT